VRELKDLTDARLRTHQREGSAQPLRRGVAPHERADTRAVDAGDRTQIRDQVAASAPEEILDEPLVLFGRPPDHEHFLGRHEDLAP
jgi:hypothetical protein